MGRRKNQAKSSWCEHAKLLACPRLIRQSALTFVPLLFDGGCRRPVESWRIGIDDVIRKSGLPRSAVSVVLLSLEMKRLVKQLPGKLFVKNQ